MRGTAKTRPFKVDKNETFHLLDHLYNLLKFEVFAINPLEAVRTNTTPANRQKNTPTADSIKKCEPDYVVAQGDVFVHLGMLHE